MMMLWCKADKPTMNNSLYHLENGKNNALPNIISMINIPDIWLHIIITQVSYDHRFEET